MLVFRPFCDNEGNDVPGYDCVDLGGDYFKPLGDIHLRDRLLIYK